MKKQSEKINNWIEENRGKHLCVCGCGQVIKIRRCHFHRGIPKFVHGHNDNKRKPDENIDKWIEENQGKHYCQCGCGEVIKILRKHFWGGITKYIKNHGNKYPSEETRRKISEGNKSSKHWPYGEHLSGEVKKKIIKTRKENFTEEKRIKISKITEKLWQDPEFVRKQMKARNVQPNKKEIFLDNIIQELLPKEFKFVGAGDFILGGRCPDFMNINGQKKLIELYGDYWHRNDDPQDRIDFFKQFGFSTLVIWERELKGLEKLKKNIMEFNNQ